MKKVYTITFHHAHNYGAMLQAYALQQTLLGLGWDNEILDYSEDRIELFRLYRKNQSFKQEVIKHNLLVLRNFKGNKRQFDLIEDFYKDMLIKTKKLSSVRQLRKYPFESSNFLVGSDQMWNFRGKVRIPEYISLDFLQSNIHYSTYAVSTGGAYQYQDIIYEQFKKLLERTEQISVREKSLKDELFQSYSKEAVVVSDPVFLLEVEKWTQLAEEANNFQLPSKYIFVFELVPHVDFQKIIDNLKEKYCLPVVVLTMALNSTLMANHIIRGAGPKEFIRLIRDSEVVISTSFHCAAISIIFHKTIYSLLTTHAPTRLVELLEKHGLSKGIIRGELPQLYSVSKKEWNLVDETICNERKRSIAFLRNLEKYYE